MKLNIEQKLIAAFAGALALLLVVGFVSWRSVNQLRHDSAMIEHTHQVIEQLQGLFAIMTDAQNSHRGYSLTGDERFLEAFHKGVSTADDEIAALAKLTADNAAQQELLKPLPEMVDRLIARGNHMIAIRNTEGLEGAQRETLTGEGKKLHDEFRTLVDQLKHNEESLLEERELRAQTSTRFARIIILAGTAICALLLLMALVAMRRDFAGRKRAEALLREGEERFRTLANNISQFAWMAEPAGHIFWYNQRWFDYTGTTLEQMEGWGWQKVHHPEHVDRVVKKITHCFETGEPWEDTFPLRGTDGNYRWFLSRAVPIRDTAGRVLRWFGTNTDVTEQRRTEETLALRSAQLESKNKELEMFTYSVSHDLKAPLRGIDGYSRLLLEDYGAKLDDDGRKFLENVRRGTVQMGQLIDDLLSYSRLERREFQRESVDVEKLVTQLVSEKEEEIQKRGAALTVNVPTAIVSADSQGLTMALRNLVDNAIKFTRDVPTPAIEIKGEMNGRSYLLSVRDNGAGFDMKFHDRIFEIFQRLHRAEDFAGTGVGLAIVRKAMERMGGRVWADSELGHGATFHLEIPR